MFLRARTSRVSDMRSKRPARTIATHVRSVVIEMKLSLVLFVLFHSASKALALQRGRVLIEPVPLQDVHLEFDSWYDKSVSLNRDYIMGLDNDRMLKTFR